MANDDEPIIIGDWGALLAKQRERGGKKSVRWDVEGDAIMYDLDEQRFGQPIAKRVVQFVMERLDASAERAAPATIERRARARRNAHKGGKWYTENYTGGRTPPSTPGQRPDRGFDSGRLRNSLRMAWVEKVRSFIMNTVNNRFTPQFLARPQGQAFMQWFATRVMQPALSPENIDQAIAESIGSSIQKVKDARAAWRKRIADNLRSAADAARGLGGEIQDMGEEESPQ